MTRRQIARGGTVDDAPAGITFGAGPARHGPAREPAVTQPGQMQPGQSQSGQSQSGQGRQTMANAVRAGLVQQRWTGDKESMISWQVDANRGAASAGGQVVCLQERFSGPYFCQIQDADYYSYTEASPGGPTCGAMREVLQRHGVVLV